MKPQHFLTDKVTRISATYLNVKLGCLMTVRALEHKIAIFKCRIARLTAFFAIPERRNLFNLVHRIPLARASSAGLDNLSAHLISLGVGPPGGRTDAGAGVTPTAVRVPRRAVVLVTRPFCRLQCTTRQLFRKAAGILSSRRLSLSPRNS
jgi:hypothetical protein